MRKSLICLAVLLSVCLTLTLAGGMWLHRSMHQVEMSRTDLAGDPAVLSDLTITTTSVMDRNLKWKTTLNPDGTVETKFGLDYKRNNGTWRTDADGDLYITSGLNYGYSGFIRQDELEEVLYPELVIPVAEKTPAGGTHGETLRLRDYMDLYRPNVDLHYHSARGSVMTHTYSSGREDRLANELADAFAVPVPENMMVYVEVEKNENGDIVGYNFSESDAGADHIWMGTMSVANDRGLWFIPQISGAEDLGEKLEFVGVPENFGLYFLPINFKNNSLTTTIDDLELVMSLPEELEVVNLEKAPDGAKMLLTGRYENHCWLVVMDRQTGEVLQNIDVGEGYEDERFYLQPENDFLIAVRAGEIRSNLTLLTRREDGLFDLQYAVEKPVVDFGSELLYNGSYYSDGEQIVLVWNPHQDHSVMPEYHYGASGIAIQVMDRTGLLYAGRFDSSLDQAQTTRWDQIIRMGDRYDEAVQVTWN